jgi:hypothetical protein
MVAAHFTTPDDRFTGGKIVGMVLGFAGLALVVGPELSQGIGFDALAYAAVWTGMLCYVAAGTLIRFVRRTSVPMMTAVNMAVGILVLTPLVLLADDPFPHMSGTAALTRPSALSCTLPTSWTMGVTGASGCLGRSPLVAHPTSRTTGRVRHIGLLLGLESGQQFLTLGEFGTVGVLDASVEAASEAENEADECDDHKIKRDEGRCGTGRR